MKWMANGFMSVVKMDECAPYDGSDCCGSNYDNRGECEIGAAERTGHKS